MLASMIGEGKGDLLLAESCSSPELAALMNIGHPGHMKSILLFHFRVWPQRQGPFADPSDLQRELAILTGFGPCHRASSEDFASYLVSLSHT